MCYNYVSVAIVAQTLAIGHRIRIQHMQRYDGFTLIDRVSGELRGRFADNMFELNQTNLKCACRCCGEEICMRKEGDLHGVQADFLTHWLTSTRCQRLWQHSPFWQHLTYPQAFIVAISKTPEPGPVALRYYHLTAVTKAQCLIANCLFTWQAFLDEATASRFILDALQDLKLVEKKVQKFDLMMKRLQQQGHLSPSGHHWEASQIGSPEHMASLRSAFSCPS